MLCVTAKPKDGKLLPGSKVQQSSIASDDIITKTRGRRSGNVKKPRAVKVKSLSPSIAKVKWRPPKLKDKSSIYGYKLSWRKKKSSNVQNVNVTSRSHTISGMDMNTWYAIWVQTITKDGRLSNQSTISYKTSLTPVTAPPRNVSAKAVGTTKVSVKWLPPKRNKDKVTDYKIQYKRRGVRRGDLCTVTTNFRKREYLLTDLIKGEVYKVRVAAKSGKETGPASNWVTVQLKGKRTKNIYNGHHDSSITTISPQEKIRQSLNLTATMVMGGVNITWNDVGMEIITYTLTITKYKSIMYIAEVPYDQNLYVVVRDLEQGTAYNITVRAINPVGVEAGRMMTSFTTPVALSIDIVREPWITLRENTTLQCVVTGYPKPEMYWMNENNLTISANKKFSVGYLHDNSTDKYVLLLTIVNVTENDRTSYMCMARNDVEQVYESTDLSFHDFHIITNVSVSALSPRVATIKWVPTSKGIHNTFSYKVVLLRDDGQSNITSTYYTNEEVFTIDNLKPATVYQVQVGPKGPDQWKDALSEPLFFETPRELPIPVIYLKIYNGSTIIVRWNNMTEEVPLYYKIIYGVEYDEELLSRKAKPPQTFLILNDLKEDNLYKVKVDAMFSNGVASSSDWLNASTSPEAYLTENIRPPPPADVFLSIQNTSLVITWLPALPEYRTLVRFYQLDVYRGNQIIGREKLDTKVRDYTLDNFDKDVEHTVYLSAVNKKGASISVLRVYQPIQDIDGSWYSVTDLRAHALTASSILVEWSPPTNRLLTRYLIRYRPTNFDSTSLKDEWLGPSHNNYVIMGLRIFQEYNITVIPYLNEITGNESWVIVKTLSSTPSSPPQNISIKSIDYTEITLTLVPPPLLNRNGLLTEYKVAYRQKGQSYDYHIYVNVNQSDILLSGLVPGTVYYIRIAAVNVNGSGPYSDWIVVETAEIPKITVPPGRPQNLTVLPIPYGVTLRWMPPANASIPVEGYIVGHGRFIPEVYREVVGVGTLQYSIPKLRKNNDYIVSVRAFNNNGESPANIMVATAGDNKVRLDDGDESVQNESDVNNTGFDDDPKNVNAELSHQEVPTIKVSWDPPREAQGTIQGYMVNYKAKGEKTWRAVLERSQSLEIKNLSFDTTYYIRVQLQYVNGQQGYMSKVVKIHTQSLSELINVLPTPTITSVFSGSDHLLVSWKPPPSDYLHVVVGYVLGYGVVEPNENQEFIPVTERSFRIEKLKPDTQYLISLKMFNEFGEGDKTVVKAYTSGQEIGR